MSTDLNNVIIIGRMTKDPELKYTQGGQSLANFYLANNRSYAKDGEKKEIVSYFNCVVWGKPAEVIAQYCKKGSKLAITGRLQQRSWEDKEGGKRSTVEIVVENFQLLSSKKEGEAAPDESFAGHIDDVFGKAPANDDSDNLPF